MKSQILITIALITLLSISSVFANPVPTGDTAYRKYLKEQINRHLNFEREIHKATCCQVNVTLYVDEDLNTMVTFIAGDEELSDYVQAHLENMKIEHPDMKGKSFSFSIDFNRQLATL